MTSCRFMSTRACPDVFPHGCGEGPCARFESDDEEPWKVLKEISKEQKERK